MRTRVKYCDALRFIAIASVILIHVLADFRDYYLINYKPNYFILTCLDTFTRMGVPLFLMFTGIFMLNDKKKYTYKEFIKKRMPKLIMPFIIISFIYYVYEMFKIKGHISIINFISLFTTNGIKYHFWYMYTIICIYLLIPYLKPFIQKLTKKDIERLILINFLMGNTLLTLMHLFSIINISMFSAFYFPNLITYINYLFLGYYLYKYKLNKKIIPILYKLTFISIILMTILDYIMTKEVRTDSFLTATSIFPFIITTYFFIFIKDNYDKLKINQKIETFFTKSASLTFYIYMFHVIVMELIKKVMMRIFVPTRFLENIIFIIIEYILTFVFSYFISIIFDKVYESIINIVVNKKSSKNT